MVHSKNKARFFFTVLLLPPTHTPPPQRHVRVTVRPACKCECILAGAKLNTMRPFWTQRKASFNFHSSNAGLASRPHNLGGTLRSIRLNVLTSQLRKHAASQSGWQKRRCDHLLADTWRSSVRKPTCDLKQNSAGDFIRNFRLIAGSGNPSLARWCCATLLLVGGGAFPPPPCW